MYKAIVLKDSRDVQKKSTSLQNELHNNSALEKNESVNNFFLQKGTKNKQEFLIEIP